MTPVIPLDLFPFDGPASLLRWGPLRLVDGSVAHDVHSGRVRTDGGIPLPTHVLSLPLRGTALDAALRSSGVALGWPVTEDGPAPTLERIGNVWLLSWHDRRTWFGGPTADGPIRIAGLADPAVPYHEAVALVARAVAARGGPALLAAQPSEGA